MKRIYDPAAGFEIALDDVISYLSKEILSKERTSCKRIDTVEYQHMGIYFEAEIMLSEEEIEIKHIYAYTETLDACDKLEEALTDIMIYKLDLTAA